MSKNSSDSYSAARCSVMQLIMRYHVVFMIVLLAVAWCAARCSVMQPIMRYHVVFTTVRSAFLWRSRLRRSCSNAQVAVGLIPQWGRNCSVKVRLQWGRPGSSGIISHFLVKNATVLMSRNIPNAYSYSWVEIDTAHYLLLFDAKL